MLCSDLLMFMLMKSRNDVHSLLFLRKILNVDEVGLRRSDWLKVEMSNDAMLYFTDGFYT